MENFDFRKMSDSLTKLLNDTGKSMKDTVNKSAKGAADIVSREKKKLSLRSQIGDHTRALNKAYTRLGEAYYNAQSMGRSLDGMQDVIDLIKSNRQVIDLLNEKLAALEKEEAKPADGKKDS